MNYISLIFIVILIIGCSVGKSTMKTLPEAEILSVISTEVGPILEAVRKEYEKDYDFANQIFVLRTERMEDKLEVIVSIYDVGDFKNCFDDTLFPFFGLYEYKANRVLVYGDDSQELFRRQEKYKKLDLLNCMEKKVEEVKNNIPYPPVAFEPIVWIYTGNSEKLSFKEQAQFNLIE